MVLHKFDEDPVGYGNFINADVSGNMIDCVGNLPTSGRRRGFGLLLGSSAWYPPAPFGGYVHDNVINGAQQGFTIDNHRQLTIANNDVTVDVLELLPPH